MVLAVKVMFIRSFVRSLIFINVFQETKERTDGVVAYVHISPSLNRKACRHLYSHPVLGLDTGELLAEWFCQQIQKQHV